MVEIIDLSVKNKDNYLLKDINLTIYENVNTFICGTSGSGKTLLVKAIDNKIKYKGEIVKNGVVEVVYEKHSFGTKKVRDELKFGLLDEEGKGLVLEFIKEELLDKSLNQLEKKIQKLVLIVKALLVKPKVIVIDMNIEKDVRKKLFSYTKKKYITVVNVGTDIEDALSYSYMIVLDKGMVAIEGQTKQVLEEEKLLKRLGIGLPFYVDFSRQLMLYGLIDKVYLDKKDLVSKLWK